VKEIESRKRSEGEAAHEQDSMGTLLATLRESEEQYKLLVEKSPDVPYSVTPDGIITFIGPQISRLGYTPEDVMAKHYLEFVVPEQRQEVMHSFEKGTKNKRATRQSFSCKAKAGVATGLRLSAKSYLTTQDVL